ncbi:MAG: tRNA (adenosine(37)-N6)-dimethylallyltransferase MiaA [Hyphomicrobiaceae bacterium]|nr:tRNA (adenosine(37)-N6)-dimethylallyltransferase MiaA [Hyphomicrobiaceae bacterium]
MTQQAVLIAGPTASGKTALALGLASILVNRGKPVAIINTDSMQLYREIPVLSAQPAPEERGGIAHHLYGTVPAARPFSTGAWLDAVTPLVEGFRRDGIVPLFVGGTGLYFRALTQGLATIPAIPAAIREGLRAEHRDTPAPALFALLERRDPLTAGRLRTRDKQRILRALEVLEATGRPLAAFQEEEPATPPLIDPDAAARFVLDPPRDWLRERITRRIGAMMEAGAFDEARAFAALKLPADAPAAKAIGLKELSAHLSGMCDLHTALEAMDTATRRYAKRQETWFRHQMPGWQRIDPAGGDALQHMAHTIAG